MKITMPKDVLEKTLKIASITVAGSGEEMKSHYLFWCRADGSVEVLGHNERLLGSVPLDCEVEGLSQLEDENRFTVEADRLNRWLSAAPDGKVSLRVQGGKVVARASLGQVTFRSMDPARFPYWEENLLSATLTGKMSARRLRRILKHAQMFVSDNEAQDPEICSCEFKDNGYLYATDSASATFVRVAGMEASTARFTGKRDISSYIRFLEAHAGEEVEFWEMEQCLFLKTSSGSLFGQSRWRHAFPDIVLGEAFESAGHWWTFNREEMLSVLAFLIPSAVRGKCQVFFALDGVGNINVSLLSAAGGKVEIPVACKVEKPPAPMTSPVIPLPEEGFPLSYEYMRKVLKNLKGETVTLAARQFQDEEGNPKGGYCSFKHNLEEDEFLIVLGWFLKEGQS